MSWCRHGRVLSMVWCTGKFFHSRWQGMGPPCLRNVSHLLKNFQHNFEFGIGIVVSDLCTLPIWRHTQYFSLVNIHPINSCLVMGSIASTDWRPTRTKPHDRWRHFYRRKWSARWFISALFEWTNYRHTLQRRKPLPLFDGFQYALPKGFQVVGISTSLHCITHDMQWMQFVTAASPSESASESTSPSPSASPSTSPVGSECMQLCSPVANYQTLTPSFTLFCASPAYHTLCHILL